MTNDKVYYLYQQPQTYQETKAFLQEYEDSIRLSYSRYMRILPHIPSNSYVLDYGFGWGIFSEMIHHDRKCQVDAIDLEPNNLEIAREFVGEKEGLFFAIKRIQEVASETYDVVISTQVAEHTLNPGNYLRECNRVLKIGGYLIISVPNIISPRYFISLLRLRPYKLQAINEKAKHNRDRRSDHLQAWDPPTFCRLLCTMGFEYETHEFMEGLALPRNLYWRNPWGLLKNWSYTMMFKMRKSEFLDIAQDE